MTRRSEKIVLTYGTFDVLHYGHIEFLNKAASLGDRLIVFVSTDKFNEEQKGKKALLSFDMRTRLVSSLRCVDMVWPEESWEQKKDDVMHTNASLVVFGSDWQGTFDYLKEYGADVLYLPRTPGISSTMIRSKQNGLYEMAKTKKD